MGAGDPMYVDRDYQIIGLPPFLHGLNALRPSNGDADVQAPASDEEWFCFEVAEPVRVFLLYDSTLLGSLRAFLRRVRSHLPPTEPLPR